MFNSFKSNKGIAKLSLVIGLAAVLLFGALAYRATTTQDTDLYRGFIFGGECECSGGNDCGECGGDCHGGCSDDFLGNEYECAGSSGSYHCELTCDCNGCGTCAGTCSGSCPDLPDSLGGFEQSCDATGFGTYVCNPIEDIVEEVTSCDCSGNCGDCLGACAGTCPNAPDILGGGEQTCDATGLGTYVCNPIEAIVETVQEELGEAADEFCDTSADTEAFCEAVNEASGGFLPDPNEWCDSHEDREKTCDTIEGTLLAMWCASGDLFWNTCVVIEDGVREAMPAALSEIGWGGIESNQDAVEALADGWCSISDQTRDLCDQTTQIGHQIGLQFINGGLGVPVDTSAPYVPNCPEPGNPSSSSAVGIKIKQVGIASKITSGKAKGVSNLSFAKVTNTKTSIAQTKGGNQFAIAPISGGDQVGTYQIHFVNNATGQEIPGQFNTQECLTLDSHGRGTISDIQTQSGYVEFTYDCGTSKDANDSHRTLSAEYKVASGGSFFAPNKDDLNLTCKPVALAPSDFDFSISDDQVNAVLDYINILRPEYSEVAVQIPDLESKVLKPLIQHQLESFEGIIEGIRGGAQILEWNQQFELENTPGIDPGTSLPPLEGIDLEDGTSLPALEGIEIIEIEENTSLPGLQLEGLPVDDNTTLPQLELEVLEGITTLEEALPVGEAIQTESQPTQLETIDAIEGTQMQLDLFQQDAGSAKTTPQLELLELNFNF